MWSFLTAINICLQTWSDDTSYELVFFKHMDGFNLRDVSTAAEFNEDFSSVNGVSLESEYYVLLIVLLFLTPFQLGLVKFLVRVLHTDLHTRLHQMIAETGLPKKAKWATASWHQTSSVPKIPVSVVSVFGHLINRAHET